MLPTLPPNPTNKILVPILMLLVKCEFKIYKPLIIYTNQSKGIFLIFKRVGIRNDPGAVIYFSCIVYLNTGVVVANPVGLRHMLIRTFSYIHCFIID